MRKIILTKEQVEEIVFANRYRIDEKETQFLLDEFEIVTKTANEYGFEIKKDKVRKIVKDLFKQSDKSKSLKKIFSGAILHIRGDYSILSTFSTQNAVETNKGDLFIFHETATNKKHRQLSNKLIQDKAVILFPGTDEEYLYELLSETTELYLFETLKKLATGLTLYLVEFEEDGGFNVKEMGIVS